ncbi:sulfatase-like hydrolase/transferase [Pontibacter kalidii]|uniref:sulfatase-like hydrolase/transferase n=1 Tax=Pontibacter kalidii TaxID=2592049 RepID=UPI002251A124|nr:sulfatase-like hydrolase/transferase [Pontibacter kalidii]
MENKQGISKKNILILCMDQWQTHMQLPEGVTFPAMERLESQGVTFERQYCTVPICTPSRATMWTGVHAKNTGLWDNTNFAWIHELSHDFPTIGHMMREQGYYTAFKGKWHLSEVPLGEDALERYGFSDFQQWGDMFGSPLEGAKVDGTAVFETVDWLEHKSPQLDQPWLLLCNLINPHDIMFYQSDPIEEPVPNGAIAGMKTPAQRLSWFEKEWPVELPENFEDDLKYQPFGVQHYKDFIDKNYGKVPENRPELWRKRRNYLINAMRLVDYEFSKIIETLDRLDLWKDTIVIFTSDHGEMNGAHKMSQKGGIHYDEAAIVNLTFCVPDGPKGARTSAVGSHLDLAPTLLEFAGLQEQEIKSRYPHLKGNSLKSAILNPTSEGPRGSQDIPGKGALYCWDGLHMLDEKWTLSGALQELTGLSETEDMQEQMRIVGEKYGAPDFNNRTFYRTVVDGQYKLVRWFSPSNYGNPSTLEELYAQSDVTLHDLVNDPLELENLAHPDHPKHDPKMVERMLQKLHHLIVEEIGEDQAPFDLNLFGTQTTNDETKNQT